MASLGSLKRGMTLTLMMIMAFFFALIMVLVTQLNLGNKTVEFILVGFLTVLFILFQWLIGPAIVKRSTKLKYLKPGENLFLEQLVNELSQHAGVPLPKLAIVEDPTPNAFVFGRSLRSSTLAVHTGLLRQLNTDEVKAVLAHEIGHLRHKDVIIMTIVSAIPILAYMIARTFMYGSIFGGGRRGGGSRNDSGLAMIAIAIISFVIYFVTQLLVLRLSRMREYYADSYSATVTENPHSLSSALAKITYGLSLSKKEPNGVRAFYIGDPSSAKREISAIMENKSKYDLDGDGVIDENELTIAMEEEAKKTSWGRVNELFSTHPPTFKRILNLKQIEEEIKTTGSVSGNIYKNI